MSPRLRPPAAGQARRSPVLTATLLVAACSGASASSPAAPTRHSPPVPACELERQAAPATVRAPGPILVKPALVAPAADDAIQGCTAIGALPVARGATEDEQRRLERDSILVAHKSERRLMLYAAGELQACWRVGLGFAPGGHKRVEGDGKTPEGWYRTSDKPWSYFDDAIAIHYPATRDADEALDDGRINAGVRTKIARSNARGGVPPQRSAMGGAVLIHGGGSSEDWTLGCIALDDVDLLDLRSRLPRGMRTHLLIVD